MHGYSSPTLVGGWKYTFGVMSSSSAWRSSLGAIVDLPQAKEQARAFHIDRRNGPENPRPLHVADGKEMVIGVRISNDADGVPYAEIEVEILTFRQSSRVADDVAV